MNSVSKSLTTVSLVVTAAVCFGFGASTRSSGVVVLKGSVVDVVPVAGIPTYVNRWCLVRDGHPSVSSSSVAIVEFGEGRSRHLYAYPQTQPSGLASHDSVLSEIETCSITRVAPAWVDATR